MGGGSAWGLRVVRVHGEPPSGDVTPSAEDFDVTQRLAEAGRLLGVTLLDHVIWERGGAFHSIRDTHPRHL